MSAECYPVTVLPHITRLYADYLALAGQPADAPARSWYATEPLANTWFGAARPLADPGPLADALRAQSEAFHAGPATLHHIELLRNGAQAVVTGQQVGLFGGPLLTLLKAATAVARAKQATDATGIPHVPIFWLATEDHDLDEVGQVTLLGRNSIETLRAGLESRNLPVGGIAPGAAIEALLEQAGELLSYAPIWETLRACYTPDATLGFAFASLMAKLFAPHGLIVMDAAGRAFHALGTSTLEAAISRHDELEGLLLARSNELAAYGYHAQVLVKPGASLLFLVDADSGERQPLRKLADGSWKAGANSYSSAHLLQIVANEPERISPNALLRPVFQDTILPTAAYIGGPAEIAYFAQSATLYGAILGRLTPVLPRFSATLLEPAIAAIMAKDEVTLTQIVEAGSVAALAQRLGARAMPIEGKRRLAAAGNAMDTELTALTAYLASLDPSLGRSAEVSASKMRYQMNRLRRMAATFETQKDLSLGKHATAMIHHLFPDGHPQERVLGGVYFLSQAGDGLIERLVNEAEAMCLGHGVVRI